MIRIQVKICCISSIEESALAIRCGADAVGLVADMPSGPGVISNELIRTIAATIPDSVDSFLLTSESTGERIVDHVDYCGTTTVQVVRPIKPAEYLPVIKHAPAVRRVQVIHVEDESALQSIAAYEPYVNAFLLDSGRPSAKVEELGGTGRTHDWRLSARIVRETRRPVFLAGGLNAENVRQAIRLVAPHAVDLCSGVRVDDRLDAEQLMAFMRNVAS